MYIHTSYYFITQIQRHIATPPTPIPPGICKTNSLLMTLSFGEGRRRRQDAPTPAPSLQSRVFRARAAGAWAGGVELGSGFVMGVHDKCVAKQSKKVSNTSRIPILQSSNACDHDRE
ncbi:hypothetical protein J1614_003750 [Plenodomus biglobosus]|nr:hypothetical protein J1614_003750 [Plenodomus biglobosus]